MLVGVYLIVSPFVLGFSGDVAAEWSDVAVGVALVIIGLLKLMMPSGTNTEA